MGIRDYPFPSKKVLKNYSCGQILELSLQSDCLTRKRQKTQSQFFPRTRKFSTAESRERRFICSPRQIGEKHRDRGNVVTAGTAESPLIQLSSGYETYDVRRPQILHLNSFNSAKATREMSVRASVRLSVRWCLSERIQTTANFRAGKI